MSRRKNKKSNDTTVTVGNVSNVNGTVNIAGGDLDFHSNSSGLSAVEIKQLFDDIYSTINSNTKTSSSDKQDLKSELEEIQSKVEEASQKGQNLEEGFLSRRFRNIARMAPDLLDVVVATLGNPLAGLGVAVKKIAEKAKEETA